MWGGSRSLRTHPQNLRLSLGTRGAGLQAVRAQQQARAEREAEFGFHGLTEGDRQTRLRPWALAR